MISGGSARKGSGKRASNSGSAVADNHVIKSESDPNAVVDLYGFRVESDAFVPNLNNDMTRRLAQWQTAYTSRNFTHSSKLKRFCRKGVPSKWRIDVWLSVSDAGRNLSANKSAFPESQKGQCSKEHMDVIVEDLKRTFPDNIGVQGNEPLLSDLKTVLNAFAAYKADPGYCQGMNSMAGILLLLDASPEQSFWLMDELVCRRVPRDYYSINLKGLRIERLVFKSLAQKYCREQYTALQEFNAFELFFDKWFVCLFIDCLPTETALRVWDLIFYENFKNFHRVAITVIHKLRPEVLAARDFMQLADLFSKQLKNNPKFTDAHQFIKDVFELTSALSRTTVNQLRVQHTATVEKEIEELEHRRSNSTKHSAATTRL